MSRAAPRFRRVNPPLPLVGGSQGVVQYQIRGLIEGQLTINNFFFLGPVNTPSPGQIQSLRGSASTQLLGTYKACLSADWSLTSETLNVVHRNDLFGTTSTVNVPAVGGRAAGHMPTEVAAVILKNTAVKGQHGRGRVSLPAISTADVTASSITAAAELTALANLANAMLTNISDGTNQWTPCVGQRSPSTPKLIVGAATITQTRAIALLGTVRRRKVGRGK